MGWVENATPEVEAESQWATIIPVCVVLSVLSIVVVSTRLWIRYSARGLAADDLMAALAMVFALIYSILCIVQTKYGLGLPVAHRPAADLIPYTRVNFAGRPFYQLGISFFKIALLISYLRLFEGTSHTIYRRLIIGTMVVIFLAHLGCTFSLIFACNPVHKSWDPLTPGSCLPVGPSFTGYAIVTIVSDVVVALIPLPVLLKLNIDLKKKVGLIVIFLLGLFTTICSILRYLEINRIQYGDGNSTMLVLWGTIEFNVGNMVSSLPFLAPVFMRKAANFRSKQSNNGYNKYGYNDSGSNSRRFRNDGNGDHYKLSSLSRHDRDIKGGESAISEVSTGMPGRSSSEENILRGQEGKEGIVKSVTVSVRVDDGKNSRM